MRRYIAILLLLTIFSSGAIAQSREVVNPVVMARSNASSLILAKVELLEEQTNLYFDVKISPPRVIHQRQHARSSSAITRLKACR